WRLPGGGGRRAGGRAAAKSLHPGDDGRHHLPMRADRIVEGRVAQGDGTREALLLEDGTRLTYEALAQRIDAAAAALADAGLGANDRMALIGENSADMVIALFAAMRIGGWAVPLNARMSADEIDG